MGKFQLRKPKIISKNFPEVGSHIDNVSKSLNDLVFSYSEQVDKALQKKHMMMAFSSLVLILVVGSFISPRGRADIATFYPETCLGGWSNPRNAEKEGETSSNADPSQFNDKNSAILDKNTSADIYCGNFNGTFNDATIPKKIIVSLAITNKEEITIGEIATTTDEVATTSEIIDVAASTALLSASSSEELLVSSSTVPAVDTSTTTATTTVTAEETILTVDTSASTTSTGGESFVEIIVGAVTETLGNIFNNTPADSITDTVVVPPPPAVEATPSPQEAPTPAEAVPSEDSSVSPEAPTSFIQDVLQGISSLFVTTVFAQESSEDVVTPVQVAEEEAPLVAPASEESPATSISSEIQVVDEPAVEEQTAAPVAQTTDEGLSLVASTSLQSSSENSTSSIVSLSATTTASSTDDLFSISSSTLASSTEVVSTSSEFLSQAPEETQNNFLEILYTFDGVTWISLGELNEISMKYRTFEIPLSASSTWSDMSQLQIKVTTKTLVRETPVTYLDAIKVEVLYDSTLEYTHPDFTRDTILNDETIDGVRLVTIINNETNEEETWYMYLEEEVAQATTTLDIATTTVATTTDVTGTSTQEIIVLPVEPIEATSTINIATSTTATTTDVTATTTATTTALIAPVVPKNKWFKLEKKEAWSTLSPREIVQEIKKEEKEDKKQEVELDRLPNFAKDLIKRIRGALLNAVIVQVEKDGKEELWLYDLENGKEQKIEISSSTTITIAKDMQIGIKDTHLFWLSEDRFNVYAFNLADKSIQVREVPAHDTSIGERGRVTFDGVGWEVIVGAQDFAFYSEQTGEVFSDDDSSLSETLRLRFGLDSVLDTDAISNLNLSVTATSTEE